MPSLVLLLQCRQTGILKYVRVGSQAAAFDPKTDENPAEVAMTKNANNLGCCKVLRESNSSNFSQLLAVGIFVSFPTHCEVNDC